MPLTALALILAAAFCHATWNLILKRSKGGGDDGAAVGGDCAGVMLKATLRSKRFSLASAERYSASSIHIV